MKSGKSV